MGSYTDIGAPVKVIIPGPRQKTSVELPKIKLHLNNQHNAMVRLPCSTVTTNSQSRGSKQQVQKLKQLQHVNLSQPHCQQPQLQPVHLVNQPTQVNVTQEPQLQPVHLVNKPTQAHVVQEQQELPELQYTSEQHVQLEKTVTFADVHYDQFGRCSPIHGGSESGRSTPTQTISGRSSPAQSIHGDQSTAIMIHRIPSSPTQSIQRDQSPAMMTHRRPSSPTQSIQRDQSPAMMTHRRPSSPTQSIQRDQSPAMMTHRRPSSPTQSIQAGQSKAIMTHRRPSSPTQSIQTGQSKALMTHRRPSSQVESIHGDQTIALMPQRRPSITQLVVIEPKQHIVQKIQAFTMVRPPTNKRKASLTPLQPTNSMQLSFVLPNQQQMMAIPKKQVEYQQHQAPHQQGYKSARKGSLAGQNIVIKIVIK